MELALLQTHIIRFVGVLVELKHGQSPAIHKIRFLVNLKGSKGERQMNEKVNEAQNERKKKIRSAKCSFPRVVNGLKFLLENERPETEIEESLVNLEKSYSYLEAKHENFMILIKDDEEYDSQEAWMDECQQRFLQLKIQANDYIKSHGQPDQDAHDQVKSLELIKGIGSDYQAAWEYLDSIYGDPRYVSDTIIQDISKFKSL